MRKFWEKLKFWLAKKNASRVSDAIDDQHRVEVVETNEAPAPVVDDCREEAVEMRGFMRCIMDFWSAPPQAFRMPQGNGGMRTYTRKDYERIAENFTSLKAGMEELLAQATDQVAYFLVSIRWPHHYADFRAKGLEGTFTGETIAILPAGDPRRDDYDASEMIREAMHGLRGAFEYGEHGVFIIALPPDKVDDYIEFANSNTLVRLRRGPVIPPQYIVGLVGKPSDEEKAILEMVLRGYWYKCSKLGFKAMPNRYCDIAGQNAFYDDLPDILKKDDFEVGLGSEWEARGALEAMHRVYIINRLIEAHKTGERPRLDTFSASIGEWRRAAQSEPALKHINMLPALYARH